MESLNEALATLINQAATGIDASMGFLQAEIPDVVVQLLLWHGIRSAFYFALCASLLLVVVSLAKKWIPRLWSDDEMVGAFAATVLGFMAFILFLITITELVWLQVWIAPKIFLIEYAANLVK